MTDARELWISTPSSAMSMRVGCLLTIVVAAVAIGCERKSDDGPRVTNEAPPDETADQQQGASTAGAGDSSSTADVPAADPAVLEAALSRTEEEATAKLFDEAPCNEMKKLRDCRKLEEAQKWEEAGGCFQEWFNAKLPQCRQFQLIRAAADFRRAGDDAAAAEIWNEMAPTAPDASVVLALADWKAAHGDPKMAGMYYFLVQRAEETDEALVRYAKARCQSEEIRCEIPAAKPDE